MSKSKYPTLRAFLKGRRANALSSSPREKVSLLSEIYGLPVDELIEQSITDSISPGICTNPGCDYTIEVEPDCFDGYCEICETQTVQSILALLHLI